MMMEWLVNNWYMIVAFIAVILLIVYVVIKFLKLPTSTQIKMIKEWLRWAVAMAEKEFGSKVGQLKLAYVYNLFIERFPFMSKIITFDQFSKLVDDALIWLNNQLESNPSFTKMIR